MYQFNKYSWALALIYLITTFAMEYHSHSVPWEGFLFSSPLIVVFIFWSEKTTHLIDMDDCNITKTKAFNRDLFLICFSFILTALLSFLLEYNNSDVRGWWAIILYFIALYGFVFALIFSGIALALDNHKIYSFVFFFMIIGLIPSLKFFPAYLPIIYLKKIETFDVITGLLIIVHLLFCLGYRVVVSMSNSSSRGV